MNIRFAVPPFKIRLKVDQKIGIRSDDTLKCWLAVHAWNKRVRNQKLCGVNEDKEKHLF